VTAHVGTKLLKKNESAGRRHFANHAKGALIFDFAIAPFREDH
jgi:hypothetical protein